MSSTPLANRACVPCTGGTPALGRDAAVRAMADLHPDWRLADDARSIARRFAFKGFAKPVHLVNLAAYQADRAGHHPDIRFGWGYAEITFTTHAAEDGTGGLTDADLICAARLDRATA